MANNRIIIRRTSTAGRTPNTTGSYATNTQYISAGELALNMADGILYTSNGSALIEIGSNNTNQNITNNLTFSVNAKRLNFATVNTSAYSYFTQQNDDNFVFYSTNTAYGARAIWGIYANSITSNLQVYVPLQFNSGLVANNSLGSAGQVLTTNSTGVYWSTVTGGSGSSNIQVQNTSVTTPNNGVLYWNSDLGKLLIYYTDGTSNQFVEATISGPPGPTGAAGAAATITVNSTTTSAPGTSASVLNSGTSSAAALDFTIPRGSTIGVNSSVTTVLASVNPSITVTSNATFDNVISFSLPAAYKVAVNSSVTTVAPTVNPSVSVTSNATFDNVISFSLPRAQSIAVNNSVTTGSPGTSASVSVTSNATFDNVISFTIPRGSTVAVNSSVTVGTPGSNPSITVTSNATFDNVINFTLSSGAVGPTAPKSITIPSPAAGDTYTLFWSNAAITLAEIRTVVQGTTPSVDATFSWGNNRSSGVTIQANVVTSNVTLGNSLTAFTNSTPAANSFLWITINNVTGTVTEYHATLRF